MNNTLVGRIASIKLNSSGNLEIALDGTEADGRLSMIVCEILVILNYKNGQKTF